MTRRPAARVGGCRPLLPGGRPYSRAGEPGEAADFIDKIGALFGIERETDVRCEELSPEDAKALRQQVRDEQSKPIINAIGEAAAKVKAFRGSPMAKALQYLENRWDHLTVFLKDPRVPLTSNAVERSLRGPVLGRNNHFGSRSKRGTEVAALFYSLIESARINGLDPSSYLEQAAIAAIRGETVPLPHEIR